MLGSSRVAAQLAASEEGLSSMKLVRNSGSPIPKFGFQQIPSPSVVETRKKPSVKKLA
jgi:hypothetical protein